MGDLGQRLERRADRAVVVEHEPRDPGDAQQRRVGQLDQVEQVAVGGLVDGRDAQSHDGRPGQGKG